MAWHSLRCRVINNNRNMHTFTVISKLKSTSLFYWRKSFVRKLLYGTDLDCSYIIDLLFIFVREMWIWNANVIFLRLKLNAPMFGIERQSSSSQKDGGYSRKPNIQNKMLQQRLFKISYARKNNHQQFDRAVTRVAQFNHVWTVKQRQKLFETRYIHHNVSDLLVMVCFIVKSQTGNWLC